MTAGSRTWMPLTATAAAVLAASLATLGMALMSEHLFGWRPCVLCLYQRLPYAVAALLTLAQLVLFEGEAAQRRVLAICSMIFAAGAALAFYHIGVIQHWWPSAAGCGGIPVGDLTPAELRAALDSATAAPACDQPEGLLLGMPLAGWNMLVSAILAFGCGWVAWQAGRRETP